MNPSIGDDIFSDAAVPGGGRQRVRLLGVGVHVIVSMGGGRVGPDFMGGPGW